MPPDIYLGAGELNYSPHACAASAFTQRPMFQVSNVNNNNNKKEIPQSLFLIPPQIFQSRDTKKPHWKTDIKPLIYFPITGPMRYI